MLTYQITFKEEESEQMKALLQFVRTLSFVEEVKVLEFADNESVGEVGVEECEVPIVEAEEASFLPIEEIRKLYPDSWVVLGNPKIEHANILGGTVVIVGKDKNEVAFKGREIRKDYDTITLIYTTLHQNNNAVWLRNIPSSGEMTKILSELK